MENKKRIINKQFNMDLDYMTKSESIIFESLLNSGHVTFFNSDACKTCGKDIVKGKKYCSIACVPKEEIEKDEDEEDDLYW